MIKLGWVMFCTGQQVIDIQDQSREKEKLFIILQSSVCYCMTVPFTGELGGIWSSTLPPSLRVVVVHGRAEG